MVPDDGLFTPNQGRDRVSAAAIPFGGCMDNSSASALT
jgi:hypothetical protein